MANRYPEIYCSQINIEAERNNIKSKKIFSSMNNVLVYDRDYPNVKKPDALRLIQKDLNIKYPGESYKIHVDDQGKYVIYVYRDSWNKNTKRKKANTKSIPEIYMVPFSTKISIAYTGSGYIIRTGNNSGFRVSNQEQVRSYIAGKEYELYNFTKKDMGSNWVTMDDCQKISKSWDDTKKRYKEIKLKSQSVKVTPFKYLLLTVSYLAIIGSIYGIYDAKQAEVHGLKTSIGELSKSIYKVTGKSKSEVSRENKSKDSGGGTFISMYYNELMKYHSMDSFYIDGDTVRVYTKSDQRMNQIKNLNKKKVFYEKR